MSLDSTNLIGALPAFRPTGITHKSSTQRDSAFDSDLCDAVNSLKNNDKITLSRADQVKMSQLKMLQGLFSVELEEDDNDFLAGVENRMNYHRFALQKSQIVDKYVSQTHVSFSDNDEKTGGGLKQLIDRIADKVHLAPQLIHSVVSVESAYDPMAVSHAGAQGLMQLMPQTAAELGVEDSFDPEQNLLAGGKYLKQLLDKYAGDLDHALAAYNWGPGNVDRHGLENMPQETCDYLVKVKNLLQTQST